MTTRLPNTLTVANNQQHRERPVGDTELSDAETLALAQFVKRLGWSEFRQNAASDDEAYLIRDAVSKLQDALAGAGYAPR